jgi:Sec-independent protein translocase protein TatA
MALWIWERWRSAAAVTLLGMLVVLLFGNAGCGNKQLEDLAAKAKQGIDQAKQQASDVSQEVKKSAQNLPGAVAAVTAGEVKLTLDAPLSSATCSARFTPPINGRRGVLHIGTSVVGGPQSYPAVYLHAPTDSTTLESLVGQTVQGELFVAKSESQGHYQSSADKPVTVQIVKLENNVVTCQLQAAELSCLDQPQTVPVAGTLIGAVRP